MKYFRERFACAIRLCSPECTHHLQIQLMQKTKLFVVIMVSSIQIKVCIAFETKFKQLPTQKYHNECTAELYNFIKWILENNFTSLHKHNRLQWGVILYIKWINNGYLDCLLCKKHQRYQLKHFSKMKFSYTAMHF